MDVAKGAASLDDQQRILDVRVRSQLLASENADLRATIADVEEKLRFGGTLRFERNVY